MDKQLQIVVTQAMDVGRGIRTDMTGTVFARPIFQRAQSALHVCTIIIFSVLHDPN